MLQRQAQTILQESSSFEIDAMPQADKDKIENRIDAATEVLQQISSHLKDEEPMTVHDYERILLALKKAVVESPDHVKHKDGRRKSVNKNAGELDNVRRMLAQIHIYLSNSPWLRSDWRSRLSSFSLALSVVPGFERIAHSSR